MYIRPYIQRAVLKTNVPCTTNSSKNVSVFRDIFRSIAYSIFRSSDWKSRLKIAQGVWDTKWSPFFLTSNKNA